MKKRFPFNQHFSCKPLLSMCTTWHTCKSIPFNVKLKGSALTRDIEESIYCKISSMNVGNLPKPPKFLVFPPFICFLV